MNTYNFDWLLFISDWQLMKVCRKFKMIDIQECFAIVGWTVNI